MKKTARVIVTYSCDRNCPGCCNTSGQPARRIASISELADYEEIVITGGEPFLNPEKLDKFIRSLANNRIYIYTAALDIHKFPIILRSISGVTVTLHAEANDRDIAMLREMSNKIEIARICNGGRCNIFTGDRLFIDRRVYDKYDLSNIDFRAWSVVRKLEWKENCEPAEHEELLYYPLF